MRLSHIPETDALSSPSCGSCGDGLELNGNAAVVTTKLNVAQLAS
jgi:hypothetical protein